MFGRQGSLLNKKLAIVKSGYWKCREFTSKSNLEITFEKKSWDRWRFFSSVQCGLRSWLPERGSQQISRVIWAKDQEMIFYSNFKLNSPKKPRDVVKGVSFHVRTICYAWVLGVVIKLKTSHCETRKLDQPSNEGEMTSSQQPQIKFF